MSSSSKSAAAVNRDSERDTGSFDDTRGRNNDGGWWMSLEEAKEYHGMWWTEKETNEKNAVSFPNDVKNAEYPIWMYKDHTMYLGTWREIRMGSGGGLKRHEHGYGIKCDRHGFCYIGQFEDGNYHGWGRSFWLKNSKVWRKNSLKLNFNSKGEEETVIKESRTDVNGEQKDNFLPFEYYGKFYNNKKHCSDGIVTLKNGTKKIGPWAHNIAVMPASFHGCGPLVTIAKDGADWWTDHHDYDSVQLDVSSPASRARKRGNSNSNNKKRNKQQQQQQQQQNSVSLPLAASTSYSTAAATVAHTNAADSSRQKQNTTGDRRDNEGSSKRTKVHDPPKIVPPRGAINSTNNNEDKKMKKKKKEINSVDVAAHDSGEEERLKNQPHQDDADDDNNDNNNDIVVIDVDAVVPDDAPSSALSSSAMVLSSSSTSTASSSLASAKSSYIYPDAILSENEELDLPLHAAVKFGDEECVLEELKMIEESKSNNGNGCVIGINTVDSKRRTALDLAALTGQLDLFKILRGVPGSKSCYMSGPRMKLIVDRRSKDVEKYLKEVREMVE